MPIDWSDDIVLIDFSDEPEFSEEMSALFERLRMTPQAPVGGVGGVGGGAADPTNDISYKRRAEPEAGSLGPTPNAVLNFASVSYLNSSHLAALLRLRKRISEGGKQMYLCALNDELSSVMRHTGLDRVFQIAPDTMTALASVQIIEERRGKGS